MQPILDLLPVLAFFAAYNLGGHFVADAERIYLATEVLLVVTVLQISIQWLRTRTVSKMLLFSAGLALVFGGLTIYLHDDRFIVWKPTLLYGLFGIAMIVSPFVSDRPLIQRLFEHQLKAEPRIWQITNLGWSLMWLFLAGMNAVFVLYFSRDAWVNWHTANTPIVMAFGVGGTVVQNVPRIVPTRLMPDFSRISLSGGFARTFLRREAAAKFADATAED